MQKNGECIFNSRLNLSLSVFMERPLNKSAPTANNQFSSPIGRSKGTYKFRALSAVDNVLK